MNVLPATNEKQGSLKRLRPFLTPETTHPMILRTVTYRQLDCPWRRLISTGPIRGEMGEGGTNMAVLLWRVWSLCSSSRWFSGRSPKPISTSTAIMASWVEASSGGCTEQEGVTVPVGRRLRDHKGDTASGAASGDPSGAASGAASGDPSGDPSGAASGDPSGDPSGAASGDPSGAASDATSGAASGDPSGAASGAASEATSGDPLGAASGDPSGATSGDPSGDPLGATSGATSGDPSDATADATADATSGAASGATSGPAPPAPPAPLPGLHDIKTTGVFQHPV
ncbi:hypothetical protein EYF80_055749 [Liparis tanakae]|uniref:Uncharacterized protein n=1 Tax=Liparis tanakae TaxID=230148 RepID=A0A4Z2EYN1_9TELE|nr:hypothetical protein EYF80_055749 [Liparis tanakae]